MSGGAQMTVRAKVMLVTLLTTALSLVLTAVGVLGYGWFSSKESIEAQLRVTADQVGASALAALRFEDAENAQRFLGSFAHSPHVRAAAFYRPDGSLLAEYRRPGDQVEISRVASPVGAVSEGRDLALTSLVYDRNDLLGYLLVRRDLSDLRTDLVTNGSFVITVMLLTFLFALVFSSRMQRVLSVPVEELVRVTDQVAREKGYTLRARRMSGDELGRLTDAFNMMLGEVQSRDSALEASEMWFRTIIEKGSEMIFVLRRDRVCTYANPAMFALFGSEPERIMSDVMSAQIVPEDRARFDAAFDESVSEPEETVSLSAVQFQRPGKDPLYVDIAVRCMLGVPGVDGVVFHCRDISDRMRIEQERTGLIEELEAKNAELERFTYTVSHDLKSPLVTITGFAGLLEKDIATGNMDRVSDDVIRIHTAAETMQRLLNELLDLSRVGRVINQPDVLSMEDLVDRVVNQMVGPIRQGGVSVEVKGPLPNVYGDPIRLLEVFQNLLENAIKFMGEQSAPRIVISAQRVGNLIECRVEDNGVGIDSEYHEKVFGLFDRLDPSAEGTGIGLSLVKRIVEVHGGSIHVESEGSKQGAAFVFTLPSADGAEVVDEA